MSSYWSATTGLALHLGEKEADAFFNEYLGKTYDPNHDKNIDISGILSEMGTDEVAFIASNVRKQAMKTLKTIYDCMDSEKILKLSKSIEHPVFYIDTYLSEEYSGALFYTLKLNTNPDSKPYEKYVTTELDDGILIFGKSVLPQDMLSDASYKSIDEIYEYFHNKLSDYLPSDFDYESHIGFFQAAVYG